MKSVLYNRCSIRRCRLTFVLLFGMFGLLWIHLLRLHRSTLLDFHRWLVDHNDHPIKNSPLLIKANITTKKRSSASRIAIFYNVFINPNNVSDCVRIIRNQTGQIAKVSRHRDTPIYYNIIGYNYTQAFCPSSLQCKQLRYFPRGGEYLTLQDLYQYCRQHPSHQVIYLHNKGSYSPSRHNELKRQIVTSVLVRLRPLPASSKQGSACNVQTYLWEPLPHFHAQSNMWLATCSYVSRLIPPIEFERRRIDMFRELLRPTSNKTMAINKRRIDPTKHACLTSVFNRSLPDITLQDEGLQRAVGMGRFCYELWVYSHPHVQPCDRDYRLGKPLLQRPYAKVYERFQHAWFRQPGRLYEFNHLYPEDSQPLPNTSFVWKYYENATNARQPQSCRPSKVTKKMATTTG